VCFLPLFFFLFRHRFRVGSYCLAVFARRVSYHRGYYEASHFYLCLFSFLLFLGEGKGTGLLKFIASIIYLRFLRSKREGAQLASIANSCNKHNILTLDTSSSNYKLPRRSSSVVQISTILGVFCLHKKGQTFCPRWLRF
jgi:hypothetical protein